MPPKRKILPQFYTEAAGRYLESVERHYSGNGSRQAYFGGIPHAGRPGGQERGRKLQKEIQSGLEGPGGIEPPT
jgi:hypothetical protein